MGSKSVSTVVYEGLHGTRKSHSFSKQQEVEGSCNDMVEEVEICRGKEEGKMRKVEEVICICKEVVVMEMEVVGTYKRKEMEMVVVGICRCREEVEKEMGEVEICIHMEVVVMEMELVETCVRIVSNVR